MSSWSYAQMNGLCGDDMADVLAAEEAEEKERVMRAAWSYDIEAAKSERSNDGQILAECAPGYFQVVSYDKGADAWRENTNMMRLAKPFLRWRPF